MAASIKSTTPFQFYRRLAMAGDGVAIQTITAALTITPYYEEMIALNPTTGTRVVTLPTAAAGAKKGQWHLIFNAGSTYALTINRPATTTLTTLAPGQSCTVVFSGVLWTVVDAPAASTSLSASGCSKSPEQTGTGAPQNVAHSLGSIPVLFYAVPSNLTGGAYVVSSESADATNVILTVTAGEKFRVVAFK